MTNVQTAKDGLEAMEIINNDAKNISMIITDYEMPNMNGVELVHSVREKINKDKLSIIGLSASENKQLVSEFLLAGANDFLSKPFDTTEFHTRINNNIEMHWLFKENEKQKNILKDYAFLDLLTKSYNRTKYLMRIKRYCPKFKEKKYVKGGKGLYQLQISVKGLAEINKSYGYSTGDKMLQNFVSIVENMLKQQETFYRILSADFVVISPNNTFKLLEVATNKIQKKLYECTKSKQVDYVFSITQYNPKNKISSFAIGSN